MALRLRTGPNYTATMSSPSQQQSKKPQKRFQFIDNSNIGASNANSTQVRRHVMQEYMREKRWESRAKAEDEVLDLSTQLQHPLSGTASTPRKSKSNSRNKVHKESVKHDGGNATPIVPQIQSTVFRTSAYNVRPPSLHDPRTHSNVRGEKESVEEVSRAFAPATQLVSKRSRKSFYLTPQSFAAISDVGEALPPMPGSFIASAGPSLYTSSSSPTSTQFENHRNSSSPAPTSMLSAARTDPFDTLPLTLSQQDQVLFDFYATVMPACSYGFERRNPRAHNWYLSVFIPEAMKSPVAFQNTILVHAANTQAWVRGLPETSLTIEHRACASEMLSQHFQKHPYDVSDAAISSTLSAAALEDFDPRTERRRYAWMHWHAAMQKIRDRGGPIALEQSKSLRMLINWSDYIFSGYDGHGSTFYFDHNSSPKHHNDTEAMTIARNELSQQCGEFIVFLKCAEGLALVTANMQTSLTAQKTQSMRYTVFRNGEALHKLLASPNGPRYTKTGQFKQIVARLAALMTINVAIWEYRYSTSASEEFFRELIRNIRCNDLDKHISVEALLQILLSGSENPDLEHTERPWLVGRLIKVAKRLSRPSWERLNDVLLRCLDLGPSLRPFVEEWEPSLRAEILSAPRVSFVLPLMQAT